MVANDTHHDSRQPVDLAALCLDILRTSAMFDEMISTLTRSPMSAVLPQATITPPITTMTTIMPVPSTPVSMGIDDDTPNDDRRQPVDLRTLQQEIIQTMKSITAFFNSLPPIPSGTVGTDQSNRRLVLVALTNNSTMASNMAFPSIAPHSSPKFSNLQEYLTCLRTKACFIPNCLLCRLNHSAPLTLLSLIQQPVPMVNHPSLKDKLATKTPTYQYHST